jgi:hypothetical protein
VASAASAQSRTAVVFIDSLPSPRELG